MPCSSASKDLEDAKLVADTFEVPLLQIDLTQEYEKLVENIENNILNIRNNYRRYNWFNL